MPIIFQYMKGNKYETLDLSHKNILTTGTSYQNEYNASLVVQTDGTDIQVVHDNQHVV